MLKCKDCKFHEFLEVDMRGCHHGDYRSRGHYCIAKVTVKYSTEGLATYTFNKYMPYKDAIKVPSWCPLNAKTLETSDGTFPIVKVT